MNVVLLCNLQAVNFLPSEIMSIGRHHQDRGRDSNIIQQTISYLARSIDCPSSMAVFSMYTHKFLCNIPVPSSYVIHYVGTIRP